MHKNDKYTNCININKNQSESFLSNDIVDIGSIGRSAFNHFPQKISNANEGCVPNNETKNTSSKNCYKSTMVQ